MGMIYGEMMMAGKMGMGRERDRTFYGGLVRFHGICLWDFLGFYGILLDDLVRKNSWEDGKRMGKKIGKLG